jgi:DHA1 family bicyclomycin/chloramphenicol resistance-like MFS transporter
MAAVTTANPNSEPPLRTPWGLVILLGSLTAMGPLAIDMYLPSLPQIGAELRATSAETQGTLAAFLAGMALGQFVYGPASDRIGRRAPLLVGTIIFVLASVVCALAVSTPMLLGGRFVQALGACAGGVVSRAVVRDRFNHTETARMLSSLTLIMGLAPILAPSLGVLLLQFGSWRLNFWFMAAVGLALTAATFFRLPESRSEETGAHARTESPLQAYRALLRERRLIGYALAGALNGAALFAYISSSPELLIEVYKVPPAHFGWLFGLNAVGVIGAGQVNRWVLRRRTPDQVLAIASTVGVLLGLALAIAGVTGVGGRWTVLPLLFGVLASYGFMAGNTMAGGLSVDPRRAGSISALMGAASFGMGALASSLAGAFHNGTAGPMALIMFGAMAASAVSLHLLALPGRP